MIRRKTHSTVGRGFGLSRRKKVRATRVERQQGLQLESLEQRLLLAAEIDVDALAGGFMNSSADVVDGSTIAFTVDYNSAQQTQDFRITNDTGWPDAALAVGSIDISGDPTIFVSNNPTAGGAINILPKPAPGGPHQLDFQLQMDPSALNDHVATVSFVNSDADENPFNFTLNAYVNAAPVAYAGQDRTVNEGDSVVLTGGFSDANERASDALTFEWILDPGGANTVLATGANADTLMHVFDDVTPGVTLRFTVSDSHGASHFDDVTVSVVDVGPTADATAGAPYAITEGGGPVTLDASNSSAPGGDAIATYEWDLDSDGTFETNTGGTATVNVTWDDGPGGDFDLVDVMPAGAGEAHAISVRVTDDDAGQQATTTALLTINNAAPTAGIVDTTAAAGTEYEIDEGQPLQLDASTSTDPNANDTLIYSWDLDDDGVFEMSSGTDATPTIPWSVIEALGLPSDSATVRQIEVRVDDGDGGVDTQTANLLINNVAPTANPGGPYGVIEGQPIMLNGAASTDPDGNDTLTTYEWDLNGAGTWAYTGVTPTIPAGDLTGLDGAVQISLRVTDNDLEVSTPVNTTLMVNNLAPTANAGGPYLVQEGNGLPLDAQLSTDPGGDGLTYDWDLNDNGVYGEAADISADATPTIPWTHATIESLVDMGLNVDGASATVTVRVTDADGAVSYDTAVLVAVNNNPPTLNAIASVPVLRVIAEDGTGGPITFTASDATNPGGDPLTFDWDLDGDGVFDDVINSATATVDWNGGADLDLIDLMPAGRGEVHTIAVRLSDGDPGGVAFATAEITINNTPPNAVINPAILPLQINEGSDLALSGVGSNDDNPNDALSYGWDINGDGIFEAWGIDAIIPWSVIEAVGLASDSTVHLGQVDLYVMDDLAPTMASADLQIDNLAPTADPGGPYVINEGQSIVLDGSGSSDPDANDGLTYAWTVNGNPYGGVNPTVPWADLVGVDGAINVALTVTDGDGLASVAGNTTLTVNNLAPDANAGGPYVVSETQNVDLDAQYSTDPGGTAAGEDPLTFDWDINNNGVYGEAIDTTGVNPTILWADLDTLGLATDGASATVTLRVSDPDGGISYDTAVLVATNNAPPTLNAIASAPVLRVIAEDGTGGPITFTASDATNPGGDPLTFDWDLDGDGVFDDVTNSTTATVDWNGGADLDLINLMPAGRGEIHTIAVRLSDGDPGGVAFATANITINNSAPTATITDTTLLDPATEYEITEGQPLALDASTSNDPNPNDTLTYSWDLDNNGTYETLTGTNATPTIPWAVLAAAGLDSDSATANTIGLRVDDGDGGFDTTTARVLINNVPPTAVHGGAYTIVEGEGLLLDASGSADVGGDPLTYAWNIDGAVGAEATGMIAWIPWSQIEGIAGLGSNGAANTNVGQIELTVTDDVVGDAVTVNTDLTINNVAPIAQAGGAYTINEGQNLGLDGSGSSDVNANDVPLGYAWDLDMDGTFGGPNEPTTMMPNVLWTDLEALGLASNGGPFVIELEVTDADGATHVDQAWVSINNLSGVAQIVSHPYVVDEGDGIANPGTGGPWPLTISGVATDPDGNDTYSYAWDLDGDGVFGGAFEPAGGPGQASGVQFDETVTWSDVWNLGLPTDGTPVEIGLEVTDNHGAVSYAYSSLTIRNLDPVADAALAAGTYTINEGDDLTLDASESADPAWDLPAGAADEPLTYSWDLNNDGDYDIIGSPDAVTTVPWEALVALGVDTDDSTWNITVLVEDGEGGSDTAQTTLTINNVAPVPNHGGPYVMIEGEGLFLSANGTTDPGDDDDDLTYEWNIDGVAGADATGMTAWIPWSTLEAILPALGSNGAANTNVGQIELTVTDDVPADAVTVNTDLTINNVAPVADAGGAYTINEGQALGLDASTSFDVNANDYLLTYDWDLDLDGTFGGANEPASSNNPMANVAWLDLEALGLLSSGAPFQIELQVTDGDGAIHTDRAWVSINNLEAIAEIVAGPYVVGEGTTDPASGPWPLMVQGRATDPDGNDTFTYAWDLDNDGNFGEFYGPGNIYQEPVGGPGVASGALFADPVTWAELVALGLPSDGTELGIGLRVTDNHGAVAYDYSTITITNLDPVADIGEFPVPGSGVYVIDEGQDLPLDPSGSTDPGQDGGGVEPLVYSWDLDYDGVFGDYEFTVDPSEAPGNGAHTVPWETLQSIGLASDTVPRQIRLRVEDGQGGVSFAATTLTINNLAPTAVPGAYEIREGEDLLLDGTQSWDPDDRDEMQTYRWDILSDGVIDFVTPNPTILVPWSYLEALTVGGLPAVLGEDPPVPPLTVTLDVQDHDNAWSAPVVDNLRVLNVDPVADAGGAYTINEGENVGLDASTTYDDNANDVLTYRWDLNNDGAYGDAVGVNPNVPWATLEGLFLASNGTPLLIGLEVTDPHGGIDFDTTWISINNVTATVDALGPYAFNEGAPGTLTLNGVAWDMDGNDTFTYAWDLDNDGNYGEAHEPVGGPGIGSGVGFADTINWADIVALGLPSDGTAQQISLRVDDGDGGFQSQNGYAYAWTTLTINNLDPVAAHGGPYVINEGEDLLLDPRGSTDPGQNAPAGPATEPLVYSWDLNYDGVWGDYEFTVDPTENVADGRHVVPWEMLQSIGLASDTVARPVRLRAEDGQGGVNIVETTLTITNLNPDADANGPYVIDEGEFLVLDASASTDPDSRDVLAYAWDLDDDGVFDDAFGMRPILSWAALETLQLADDGTPLRIFVQVTDGEGGLDVAEASLTINNVAPTAEAGGPYTMLEGTTVTLDGTDSSDPSANDTLSYAWDLDNDGLFDDAVGATPTIDWTTIELLGLITNGGPNPIWLQVSDGENGVDVDMSTIMIVNIPPTVDAGLDQVGLMGSLLSFDGTFSDPAGVLDVHEIEWDFGDGNTADTIDATHTYTKSGIYTVTLTVTDSDLGQITDTMQMTVEHQIEIEGGTSAFFHNLSGTILVNLTGPGRMELYHIDGLPTDFNRVELFDTDATSALNITTVGLHSSAHVGDVTVHQNSLGAFRGYTTSLHGTMAIDNGSLSSMLVDNVIDGADVRTSQAPQFGGTTLMAFGDVGNADFAFASDVPLVLASSFTGGSLTANDIGVIINQNDALGAQVTALNGSIDVVVSNGGVSGGLIALDDVGVLLSSNGTVSGTVRGQNIGTVLARDVVGAMISAANQINMFNVTNDVIDAHVLAGYDIGMDGIPGAGDALNGGDIRFFNYGGTFANTHVAIGVDPIFSPLVPQHAGGSSSLEESSGRILGDGLTPNNGGQLFGFYYDASVGSSLNISLTPDDDFVIVDAV